MGTRTRKHLVRIGDEQYLPHSRLSAFLADHGYEIAKETLRKKTMPSRGGGPRVAGRWQRERHYKPAEALAWAQQLFATEASR
jgi:hypothetical protein